MNNTEQLIARLSSASPAPQRIPAIGSIFIRWCGVSMGIVVVMLSIFGLRDDLSAKLANPFFIAEMALLLLVTTACALLASALSFPDLHGNRRLMALAPLCAAGLLLTLLLAALGDTSSSFSEPPSHGLECAICIALFSVVPASWMFVLLRSGAPTQLPLAGSAAVLASCAAGALILRLSEKTDSVSHLVIWHYAPLVLFALAGAWCGKKFLKW